MREEKRQKYFTVQLSNFMQDKFEFYKVPTVKIKNKVLPVNKVN